MKSSIKSCVTKRTWQHYKTCFECTLRKKCASEYKPNWFGQIYESVAVWLLQKGIKFKMRRLFKGFSRRDIKNAKRYERAKRMERK